MALGINLSVRTYNALHFAGVKGVKSLDDLLVLGEADLMRIRGIGRKGVREIVDALFAHGHALATLETTYTTTCATVTDGRLKVTRTRERLAPMPPRYDRVVIGEIRTIDVIGRFGRVLAAKRYAATDLRGITKEHARRRDAIAWLVYRAGLRSSPRVV